MNTVALPKALLVDDSLTVRMDLAEAFDAAGFRPLPCASVAAAREVFRREAVDVVVLDVVLPDGDGVSLIGEIRALDWGSQAVVLVLSSETDVADRARGLRTGADEYVGKPYDRGYVVSRARELLRARRAGGAASATVLVVDDSVTYREELRRALEQAGYHVLLAATGEEGLHIAADVRPSALVVDGVLPGIDGATVVRRVRLDSALRGMPCLLLTGSEEGAAELAALDAGADDFVRKDNDLEVVLAKLGSVLRGSTARVSSPAESVLGPRRILAVDDSPTYLHEVSQSLRAEGYDVVLARSGEEALELLAVQSVDCILLDLAMPGLGGQETCRRIKSGGALRNVPLVVLTAVEDRSTMLECLSLGADDYISKASELDVVKARVRAQLRRKQFEDENRAVREQLLRQELEAAEARAAREIAETRAKLVEELERKNRELEAFSYSVSHDLRAPLRAIDGFSQALFEDHRDRLDGKAAEYLERVRAAAKRMSELIDDLLLLSRVNRAEMAVQEVDLTRLASDVVAQLRARDQERVVEVAIEDGLVTYADTRLVKLLLENLLGNAWKFTLRTERAAIRLVRESTPHGEAFAVRDNGTGFEMAYADQLFQPFRRLHSEAEFPGTGIGLATVYRVVDRHGGRVWAEGAPGAGATFYFTLPSRPPS